MRTTPNDQQFDGKRQGDRDGSAPKLRNLEMRASDAIHESLNFCGMGAGFSDDSPQKLYLASVDGFPDLLEWAAKATPSSHALQAATDLVASYSPEQVISAIRNTPFQFFQQKPGYSRALVLRALSLSIEDIISLMADDCLELVRALAELADPDDGQSEEEPAAGD